MAINALTGAATGITGALPSLTSTAATPATDAASGFAGILKDMVSQTVSASQQAESLTMAAAQGQQIPLHEVIQAVGKAELTLQTLITVRDRAVEAYQQIQQMPI